MPLGIILSLIFMTLKLTDVIDWSWFYVFLPVIIQYSLAFLFMIIAIIGAIIAERQTRNPWDK